MSQGDDIQIVVFTVGGQEFAFDIFHVQRILAYEAPAPLPKAPPFLEGVLATAGGVVPVIDLRKRFEIGRAQVDDHTRIMVVECDGQPVGAVADAVTAVLRVSAASIAPPPAVVRGLAAEYVQGVITLPGRVVILLQATRLLTSTERIVLERLGTEPADG